MSNPRADLRALIDGYRASQIVCVAAELGLPELVNAGVRTCPELAERIGADAPALRRLLRALCALGVFDAVPPDGFAPTEMSRCLLADTPRSLAPWARLVLDQFYGSWGALREAVITGRTGFEAANGVDAWSHRGRNVGSARLFSEAMASGVTELCDAVAEAYDFSGVRAMVDVGGGDGTLARSLVRRHAALRATVLDAGAPDNGAPGMAGRLTFARGDFLAAVPPGADCYMLSRVLHDWADADAVRILKNIARGMDKNAVVLIVERVLTPNPPLEFLISDINMMVMNGGRERTVGEFEHLLEEAGLRFVRCRATASPVSILEARRG